MGAVVNDIEIVAALQAGDPGALESLIERYAARICRVAFRVTRDHADAEEVMQDVFLAAFRKIGTFEGRAALGTWIYRVTANLALTRRRRTRLPGRELHALEWIDHTPTPEEHVLALEMRAITGRLVEGLPVSYRAVVLLRDVEGLSTSEVADAVGTSIACVKSRLHRARALLRQRLVGSGVGGASLGRGRRDRAGNDERVT